MVDLPTVVSIILASVSVVGIFGLTIKAMRRNEARLKAMSDEIEAIISEAAAGQSESLLPSAKAQEATVAPETDTAPKAPRRKAVKTNHERCAADFIPHQYRDEIAA